MFEVVEKGLMKIVGHENVASDVKVLEEYSKDYSFAEPRKPMLVVYPKKADEVSSIVRWANENVIPITPVSSGPPRFRGDTVPSEGGIILDLSRL
ncbi:MAG: FAD-binding protein, partial [Candidatus Bathyarchaeia archaeon]